LLFESLFSATLRGHAVCICGWLLSVGGIERVDRAGMEAARQVVRRLTYAWLIATPLLLIAA